MEPRGNVRVVNIHEAKTTLSRLIERALLGEEIMIAKNHVPIVKLVPLSPPPGARILGALAGKIHVGPDFDADDALASDFEGTASDPLRSGAYPVLASPARRVAEPGAPRRRRP